MRLQKERKDGDFGNGRPPPGPGFSRDKGYGNRAGPADKGYGSQIGENDDQWGDGGGKKPWVSFIIR